MHPSGKTPHQDKLLGAFSYRLLHKFSGSSEVAFAATNKGNKQSIQIILHAVLDGINTHLIIFSNIDFEVKH
jgi:hypothetical protein